MAFDVGGGSKKKVKPTMNVTPLVDVVLVLLIIFMVITPLLTKQFWLHVPKKDEKVEAAPPPPDDPNPPAVIVAKADGRVMIGPDFIADHELSDKVRRILAARADNLVFFGAEPDVPFGRAMEVLDLARGGGGNTIAVMTDPLQ